MTGFFLDEREGRTLVQALGEAGDSRSPPVPAPYKKFVLVLPPAPQENALVIISSLIVYFLHVITTQQDYRTA